jgi:hypothetical protein
MPLFMLISTLVYIAISVMIVWKLRKSFRPYGELTEKLLQHKTDRAALAGVLPQEKSLMRTPHRAREATDGKREAIASLEAKLDNGTLSVSYLDGIAKDLRRVWYVFLGVFYITMIILTLSVISSENLSYQPLPSPTTFSFILCTLRIINAVFGLFIASRIISSLLKKCGMQIKTVGDELKAAREILASPEPEKRIRFPTPEGPQDIDEDEEDPPQKQHLPPQRI